jgi:hypothetical protein
VTIHAIGRLFAWWLATHAIAIPQSDPEPWRLYTAPCLHVGLRPAASFGEGIAVTLQVSACVNP